jgi:hypothetical protein
MHSTLMIIYLSATYITDIFIYYDVMFSKAAPAAKKKEI